jgi:hypothetical protein
MIFVGVANTQGWSSDVVEKAARLLDLEELNVEDQLRVRRDAREALLAVCQLRWDGDTALATDSHASDADVPALDNFTLSEFETKGLSLLVGWTERRSLAIK